jgi:hypothetical protein
MSAIGKAVPDEKELAEIFSFLQRHRGKQD